MLTSIYKIMKKNLLISLYGLIKNSQKFKIMRLSLIFLFIFSLGSTAKTFSQNQTVTINAKNISINELLTSIHKQTNLNFIYNSQQIKNLGKVDINVSNKTVKSVLENVFSDKPFSFKFENSIIVIFPKKNEVKQTEDKFIKGVVVDENGNTLPGVSVSVKGTQVGVSTNIDGTYELKLPNKKNIVLVYEFVGMIPKEVKYKGQKVLRVVLSEDKVMLGEVVVTGFQTISKERATGAYSKVDVDVLEKNPVTDITSTIATLVPGLTSDVDKNGNTNLVIRGKGSLTGGSYPLIVVDGFPIDGDLASINPNDIQDVTVLKDAASTSIYGARAANGVIVVTTKKAKKEEFNVSYSGFVKISNKYDLDYSLGMMNSEQQINREIAFMKNGMFSDIPADTKWRQGYSYSQSLLIENNQGRGLSDAEMMKELNRLKGLNYRDDYDKYLLRNPLMHQHNISVSGKGEKNTYRLSAMFDQNLTGYQYNRINKYLVSLYNLYKFNDKLSIGFNASVNIKDSQMNGVDFSEIKGSVSPYQQLVDKNGDYTDMPSSGYYLPYRQYMQDRMPYKNWRYNILEEARNRDNNFNSNSIRLQTQLNYKIIEGLTLTSQFQYELFNNHWKNFSSEKTFYVRNLVNTFSSNKTDKGGTTYDYHPEGFSKGGILFERNTEKTAYNFRTQLEYKKEILPKHNINVLVGTEAISSEYVQPSTRQIMGYDPLTFTGNTFDFTKELEYHEKNGGKTTMGDVFNKPNSLRNEYREYNRYFSGYFNFAYSYDDTYSLSISMRTDASNFVSESVKEKFSPFWSVGSMWNIHKENFIADNFNWINRLSLRASYGVVGLPAARQNLSTLTTVGYGVNNTYGANIPFANIMSYGLSDLTWEKSNTFNLGIDFSLFSNKLFGSIEFYNKYSTDVVASKSVAAMINPNKILSGNFAEVLNRGVELQLGSNLQITKGLEWNGLLNVAYNYNEVTSFDYRNNVVSNYLAGGTFIEGKPIDYLNTYQWVGVSDQGAAIVRINGQELTIDKNLPSSDINQIDYVKGQNVYDFLKYSGRRTPSVTSTFRNSFKYKNFELIATVSGKFGHKFLLPGVSGSTISRNSFTTSEASANGWSNANKNSNIPKTSPEENVDNTLLKSYGHMWSNYYNKSTANVRDASFIRFNDIYLGYTLPKAIMSKLKLKNVTLYAQMSNVGMLWTANKENIDPEYIPRLSNVVKPPKTYTFGLKITF